MSDVNAALVAPIRRDGACTVLTGRAPSGVPAGRGLWRRGTLRWLLLAMTLEGCSGSAVASPDEVAVSVMKSDLRNLSTAQEAYFTDYHVYAVASDVGLFAKSGANIWRPSTGVNVVAPGTAATTNGWNAQTMASGTTRTCSIYVGAGGTGLFIGSGQQAGEPTCY